MSPTEVVIDGKLYRPVDVREAQELERYLREFRSEGTAYWREVFLAHDPEGYEEGDEEAPFFSEAFLYNLLGKDEARSVLGIVRRLCVLAGVEMRR